MARPIARTPSVLLIIALILFVLGGCALSRSETGPDGPGGNYGQSHGSGAQGGLIPAADEGMVTLYFADHQAQHVVPEQRRIHLTGNESPAAAVVRELLLGPIDPYLRSAFPGNVRLASVEVSDGVAYVNFEEGISIPGSTGETIAVRSLVYTLTDLDDVAKVQILVGGRGDVSLGGHMVLKDPVERGPILDYPIFPDEERVAWLQAEADAGRQAWRRDPLAVVRFDGKMAGLTGKEDFMAVESGDPGIALYRVTVDDITYQLELVKADRQHPGSIWVLTAVDRVN